MITLTTPSEIVQALTDFGRSELANLLQLQIAQAALSDSPHAKVVTSTSFQGMPQPTTNPTLVVDITMPSSAIASDDAYLRVAHWLADAAVKVDSEISGSE